MSTAAISGVGAKFKRGDGAVVEAFTAIAEVNSINGPTMSREQYDATSLDSTGGYREYIPGFRDGGDVTIAVNFTLAGFNTLLDDFQNDDARNYQIVLPDAGATTLQFAAFVTNMPLSIVPDDKITYEVTFKVTGALTLTT